MLDFNGTKRTVEETLKTVDEAAGGDQSEVSKDLGGDGVSGVLMA
jgi:hypothetical protein